MYYIVQFGSTKTPAIKNCIEQCGEKAEIFDWRAAHKKPTDLEGVIFSGSPAFLTETGIELFQENISPLLNWNVPVLGICFGHQVLGMLYGGRIFRNELIRKTEKIMLREKNILFAGLVSGFEMTEDHTEGISLPSEFRHVAYSQSYALEAMKHKEKPFWGVQFHPEVSGENGMTVFKNFISICKNGSADDADPADSRG